MDFLGLLSRMLVLFILICIGILSSKVKIISEDGCQIINKIVFYICSPALILNAVIDSQLSVSVTDVLLLLLYAVIFNIVALIIGYIAAHVFCKNEKIMGAMNLVISFGNFAFMGFPVISALYGDGAIFLVSVCSIPFNVFLFSVGAMLVARKKGEGFPAKKVFTNPSLISTVIAFFIFLFKITVPKPIAETIGYMGNTVVPMSMLLIGASLGRMSLKSIFCNGWKYWVCFVKLLVMPLILWLLFRSFVKDELILGILVVIAAMPSAASAPVLCTEYGGDSEFASGSVFLTTLLSLLTVPVIVYLLLL